MRRLLGILNVLMTAALVGVIGVTAFLAFSARLSRDRIPTLMGNKVLTVLSGSMEPAIRTGDAILVKPLAPDQTIREGEIITFRSSEQREMLITHRVVGVVAVNGEPRAYVTKGDANDTADLSTVGRDQVFGVYQGRILYLGYISNFLRKPAAILFLVILPGLVLIGFEFRRMWQALAEHEQAQKPNR